MENKRARKTRVSTDLTQKELAMLRTTSKLSDKEIKLWHTEFLRKYPSGKLDKDTFIELYKELYPAEDTVLSCNTLFNVIDLNHDNTIDFNEFLFLAAVGNRTGSVDERLDIVFDLWDVSSDGLLNENEVAHLVSAMYDRVGVTDRQGDKDPHKRAKQIINQLDKSGDKKLSKEEFINGCKSDEIIKNLLIPDS